MSRNTKIATRITTVIHMAAVATLLIMSAKSGGGGAPGFSCSWFATLWLAIWVMSPPSQNGRVSVYSADHPYQPATAYSCREHIVEDLQGRLDVPSLDPVVGHQAHLARPRPPAQT